MARLERLKHRMQRIEVEIDLFGFENQDKADETFDGFCLRKGLQNDLPLSNVKDKALEVLERENRLFTNVDNPLTMEVDL